MDGSFRKIDVDAFDEDVLHESELYDAETRDPAQVLDDAKQKSVAVRSLLSKFVLPYCSSYPALCIMEIHQVN